MNADMIYSFLLFFALFAFKNKTEEDAKAKESNNYILDFLRCPQHSLEFMIIITHYKYFIPLK